MSTYAGGGSRGGPQQHACSGCEAQRLVNLVKELVRERGYALEARACLRFRKTYLSLAN
jgi:hypothetical protein